ncbi:roadblock/LC7 domain-containing protein [Nitrogeniibacter aestuarii]|uniref:roadblock/LC7 domain-containing protein n=1 Tax=Nitrogeniibacter aestuarii TaxID=2815343 RepID=UPI001D122D4C|nr:roadblock/LC7 domain-containing protein [Nitrogeniibacter aestuarii]
MQADELRAKRIRSLLRNLAVANGDIESSAVISSDGLVIATVLHDGVDADRFGAMCASLLALAERAAGEVGRGKLKQTLVEGEAGSMLLVQAGTDTVLALAARTTQNLGRVFLDARRAAAEIATLMAGNAA